MVKTKSECGAWTEWCEFCDEAKVAPDTTLSAHKLAVRYNQEAELGGCMTADHVRRLMPDAATPKGA